MLLVDMTGESLSKALQMQVPDEYVIMAKHQVLGFEDEEICEVLSCDQVDLETAKGDPVYKAVKAMVAGAQSQAAIGQSQGWDALESLAIEGLVKKVRFEKDPEFLLKVAAVANRATRKTQRTDENTLDPMSKGVSRISLTSRLVQRISNHGAEQVEERELSITSGSMGRATFSEVNELLEVKTSPVLPRALEVQTHTAEPHARDLVDDLMNRLKR